MPLVHPNIVPENNLRLPDALTIKHGPARLLSRFVIEGDKAARDKGIEVRLRHDFDELVFLNKHQTALGNWYPLVDMMHPDRTELTPENAFWISAENRTGEIVATWGARIFDWTETNLAEQARTMWYGRDLGQPCIVTAEAAARISGFAICGAASWVRPDRISLPIIRTQAVTVLAAAGLVDMISSASFAALDRQTRGLAQPDQDCCAGPKCLRSTLRRNGGSPATRRY